MLIFVNLKNIASLVKLKCFLKNYRNLNMYTKKWTDEIKKLLHLSDLILNIKNTHPTIRVKMIILLSQFDSNLF